MLVAGCFEVVTFLKVQTSEKRRHCLGELASVVQHNKLAPFNHRRLSGHQLQQVKMTLDDFEKQIAEGQAKRERGQEKEKDRERRRHRHRDEDREGHRHRDKDRDRDRERSDNSSRRHHRHHSSRHDRDEDRHRHKRSRHNGDDHDERSHKRRHRRESRDDNKDKKEEEKESEEPDVIVQEEPQKLQRDAWMEAPSALDVDYVQRRNANEQEEPSKRMLQVGFEQKLHEKELNRHLHDVVEENAEPGRPTAEAQAEHVVDYTIGDAGSQWRMTRLRAVYRQAEEMGRKVEDVAIERFGDLRSFDDAREEETELDRRERYGEGYVGKDKPTGELFEERKLKMGLREREQSLQEEQEPPQGEQMQTEPVRQETKLLDPTALNRLKAKMMKAKLMGSSQAADLEAEYNAASAAAANNKGSDVVVLGVMDNRMLSGGKRAEAKPVETKRGQERGLVEQNDEMSIDDMVREERRTRGQAGGEGMRFAERIAKDTKFDVSLLMFCYCRGYYQLTVMLSRMTSSTWTRTHRSLPDELKDRK